MARRHMPAIGAALVAVLLISGALATGPVVVSSSEEGIVLTYTPGSVAQRQVMIGDSAYAALEIEGADAMGVPGAPDVPVVRLTLAVPDCRDMELTVSTSGRSTVRGVRVIPALTTVEVEEGEVSKYEYAEGDQYARGGLWPPSAASMTEPRWLSRQRVVHVELHPCQVDPVEGTLVSHETIEVRLSFRGVRSGRPLRGTSERWERLYRSVLANYESGRAWRTLPDAGKGRPDEYFDTSANWLKLTVDGRGIYGVGHDDLEAAGVDPATVDPASIRVFTGTGLELPADVTDPRPDWMDECTISVAGGGDGVFDEGDRLVFYALGVDAWSDELPLDSPDEGYYENRFAGTAVYWLTWESGGTPFAAPPLRMVDDDLDDDPDPVHVTDYRARAHYEENLYDFLGRGDNFYMYEMKRPSPEHRYFYERLTHVVTDSTGSLRARVDGNSTNYLVNPDHVVYFYLNDAEAYIGEWEGYSTLVFESDGLPFRDFLPLEPGPDYNSFDVFVARADSAHVNDSIIIDWFEFKYWRELWADLDSEDDIVDDQLAFGSSGRTGALEYSLDGFETDDVSVFKIIDRRTVRQVPGVSTSGSSPGFGATFQDDVADTTSYIAVSDGGYLRPGIERYVHAGLRADTEFDYVMVVYDGFYDEALRLKSHRESAAGGGYEVRLVRVSDVYSEFSWGVVDPSAIRDYLKYLSDNAVVPPTHALLIGDSTFDYRHYLTTGIECFIPTYYTGGVLYWPTDFWFVGFDAVSQYEPGMALGRLTVRSSGELSTVIDKIERYETETVQGIWKNTVVLIGDDEWRDHPTDGSTPHFEYSHTEQAEEISREVLPWSLDRLKIYLMEYEFDSAWHKPGARTDLLKVWNDGALILNYTGHGNELLMAHELIFIVDDIPTLKNIDRLPLFFAASCRLNKFDMPNSDSVGELLVKSPVGGAIASIGSTRDSGSGYNSALNRSFLRKTFGDQRDAPTAFLDFGQALQAGFIETSSSHSVWVNNTKFALVGDPATTFVSPGGWGEIDEDGVAPMRRRDRVTATGHNAGSTADDSGVALVRVHDTSDTSGYVQPQSQYLVRYHLPGEVVFEGAAVVSDGDFTSEFVVSALAEEGPYGRIRAYFYDGENDGSLSLEGVTIADSVEVSDASGPDISLSFEGGGTSVLPGDELEVRLSDENGINLVNRAPGDGIVLLVNGGEDSTDVTNLFVYDLGSFREGAIVYPLPSLGFGNHTVSVAARDNMGNRSSRSLQFEIVSSTKFSIRNVANHPNPFPNGGDGGTHIMFELPVSADVTIDIFTVGGRRLLHMGDVAGASGANEVYWNGRDAEGDELANGVYLYRIHAVSDEYRGDKAEVI
ncbi:MAG: type IX secretion system sortase PorU, partial [Candidatus Eisenbacteria bacterium]